MCWIVLAIGTTAQLAHGPKLTGRQLIPGADSFDLILSKAAVFITRTAAFFVSAFLGLRETDPGTGGQWKKKLNRQYTS
ncbi:MAG: hypothetical protein ACYTER_00105, partial [Planctomycetota bacterium]|jgi:hypothetical protein